MTVIGNRDEFTKGDLLNVAASNDLKGAEKVIQEALDAVARWPEFARQAGVEDKQIRYIAKQHRVSF